MVTYAAAGGLLIILIVHRSIQLIFELEVSISKNPENFILGESSKRSIPVNTGT